MLGEYKRVLFDHKVVKCTNVNIKRTEKFGGLQMNTLKQEKIGLDYWEDKRFWLNGLQSIPYGLRVAESRRPVQQRIMRNLFTRALLVHPLTREHFAEVFGIEKDAFMLKLQGEFKVGMCWRNYGKDWELDHIIPVSYTKKAEFEALSAEMKMKVKIKLVHYTNIQPMLSSLNDSKNDTITEQAQKMLREL